MNPFLIKILNALWWAGLFIIDGYITKRIFTPIMIGYAGSWLFYVAGTLMIIFFLGFGAMLFRLPHDINNVFGRHPDATDQDDTHDQEDQDEDKNDPRA